MLDSIDTSGGRVRGLRRADHLAFLGIPYAADTGGNNRFQAPAARQPWRGVLDAFQPGCAAPQPPHPIPGFSATPPQSEDCLNLNIFTPAADNGKRPVLVWIHGGGYTHGSGSEPLYDGGALAARGDVVIVTFNYRLGYLGFLYLPEAGFASNLALQDQAAALLWVRDNIGAFGGDPANVTIFGESAGARSVGCLLAMPAASSLFRRAILQSGVGRSISPETASANTSALLAHLSINSADAAILTKLPVEKFLTAQEHLAPSLGGFFDFSPVLDEVVLTDTPESFVRDGRAAGIDLLIGTNRDEMKLFTGARERPPLSDGKLAGIVAKLLPGHDSEAMTSLIKTYRASRSAAMLPSDNLSHISQVRR